MPPICGQCGKIMLYKRIAPCFDCGGRPNEIDDFKKGIHQFYYFPLFDDAVFCDFCINDIGSTDPEFWGFPPEFDWNEKDDDQNVVLIEKVKLSMGWVCTKCHCTDYQQKFVIKNAKRYGQKLPNVYWKYLSE